jgi:hypothetical protein
MSQNSLNFLGEQLGNSVGGFLHAMASFGFSAVKLYGLVQQFQSTKLNVERNIQFHESHSRGKLPFKAVRHFGRRFNRAYDWPGGMFVLGEKRTNCVEPENLAIYHGMYVYCA